MSATQALSLTRAETHTFTSTSSTHTGPMQLQAPADTEEKKVSDNLNVWSLCWFLNLDVTQTWCRTSKWSGCFLLSLAACRLHCACPSAWVLQESHSNMIGVDGIQQFKAFCSRKLIKHAREREEKQQKEGKTKSGEKWATPKKKWKTEERGCRWGLGQWIPRGGFVALLSVSPLQRLCGK